MPLEKGFCLFVCCGTKDGTQGLSTTELNPKPLLFFIWRHGFNKLSRLSLNCDPPILASESLRLCLAAEGVDWYCQEVRPSILFKYDYTKCARPHVLLSVRNVRWGLCFLLLNQGITLIRSETRRLPRLDCRVSSSGLVLLGFLCLQSPCCEEAEMPHGEAMWDAPASWGPKGQQVLTCNHASGQALRWPQLPGIESPQDFWCSQLKSKMLWSTGKLPLTPWSTESMIITKWSVVFYATNWQGGRKLGCTAIDSQNTKG